MNAYYQIINDESGTKLKLFPATDGGREMVDLQELMDCPFSRFLSRQRIWLRQIPF